MTVEQMQNALANFYASIARQKQALPELDAMADLTIADAQTAGVSGRFPAQDARSSGPG